MFKPEFGTKIICFKKNHKINLLPKQFQISVYPSHKIVFGKSDFEFFLKKFKFKVIVINYNFIYCDKKKSNLNSHGCVLI